MAIFQTRNRKKTNKFLQSTINNQTQNSVPFPTNELSKKCMQIFQLKLFYFFLCIFSFGKNCFFPVILVTSSGPTEVRPSLGSIISAVSKLIFVPNEQKDKQYYLLHVFYIFGKQYGYLQFVFSIEKYVTYLILRSVK